MTTLAFTLPNSDVEFVRGTVRLQLVVGGPAPDSVELYKDGTLLVILSPPYSYDWPSDPETESEHVFEARAVSDGAIVAMVERRFTVDRTPPVLVSSIPLEDATDVALRGEAVLSFSERLAPSTVTVGNVHLNNLEVALAHTVAVGGDGTEIRLAPTEAPASLPASCEIVVGTGITDLAGNPLATAVSIPFTFGDWIEIASRDGLGVGAIREIEGYGSDLWVLSDTGGTAALHRYAAGLTTAIPLPPGITGIPRGLRLTSEGLPVVAVQAGGMGDILVMVRQSDGTWSILPPLVGPGQVPDIEIAADDTPYVARYVAATASIDIARGATTGWTEVASFASDSSRFDFALDASGTLVLGVAFFNNYDCQLGAFDGSSWVSRRLSAGRAGCQACAAMEVVADGRGSATGLLNQETSCGAYRTTEVRGPGWSVGSWRNGHRYDVAASTSSGFVAVEYAPATILAPAGLGVVDELGHRLPIASAPGFGGMVDVTVTDLGVAIAEYARIRIANQL